MSENQEPKEEIVDQDNNGLDDRLERKVEIGLAITGTVVGSAVGIIGALKGNAALVWAGITLDALSFALYQGTSIAKINKF